MDIKSVPMAAADAIVRMLTFIVDVMLSLPWPVEHGWLDNGLPVSLARCCAVAALPMTMTMTPMFPQASALSAVGAGDERKQLRTHYPARTNAVVYNDTHADNYPARIKRWRMKTCKTSS